ncbi:hydroxymethylglutaryl-CoA lyase [Lentzea sp. JNUCC 0626]|uniref:hydroxymethylglutaryl-CoA lyase n=1 Tax=Lentzea sp. JNUCC 0626 TaxID=3367513 RepID=UPI003747E535
MTRLRDVTLRDGLQLTGKPLSTAQKLDTVRTLRELGVPLLEIGSMARPDLVPSMANTVEVISELTAEELADCWVWVATPRHVERAAEAGARNFQYCLSASDSHNQANIGRTTDASLEALPKAAELAAAVGGTVQLCVATAFTCPFEGAISPNRVLSIVRDERAVLASEVVLCDTLGQAVPQEVHDLVSRTKSLDRREITYHGHDTWGLGVANSLAAVAAGATTVDGALGGLGGCPFAPGAAGNTATEDLLFALRPDWLDPEKFGAVVRHSARLLDDLGEPNRSRSAAGALAGTTAFAWAVTPSELP